MRSKSATSALFSILSKSLCFVFKARAETGRERNRGRAPVPGSGETFAADPDAERRLLQVRQGREDHLLQRRPLRHHGVEDLHRKSRVNGATVVTRL